MLEPIFHTPGCDEVSCPTIYQNESGNIVIQGYKVAAENRQGTEIPEGEDVVEVPKAFLDAYIAQQNASQV